MLPFFQKPVRPPPWNKGKLMGQKPPLKPHEIQEIRLNIQRAGKLRDLALFNMAIDSKLRGCDLVKLRVHSVTQGAHILKRAMVLQQKTKRPVHFEITGQTRQALSTWINHENLSGNDYLFRNTKNKTTHIKTRQYAKIVKVWVAEIGLDPRNYGTHSLRRTKASIIYRQTKDIRAIQILLGHSSLESTVRYLGIEVDDALEISEQIEI